MDQILRKNIASYMEAKNLRPSELARRAKIRSSTLQGVIDRETADPQLSTIAAIAAGLEVPIGRLLEEPSAMDQPAQPEKSREELFAALVEKAVHLDKDGLAMLLAAIDSGLTDGDCDGEPLRRLENEK